MAAIGLAAISKSFGATQILKSVSLEIRDGEFLTLLGSSGSGKSTLLRIIAGLEDLDSGTVLLDGKAVNTVRPADRNIAMVFQHYALYPHMSVRNNISLPLLIQRTTWIERLPGAARLMPKVRRIHTTVVEEVAGVAKVLRLEHLLDRMPSQLSGGQKQRVAMARAMVRHPAAFLMDEPLSSLDASLRTAVRSEIMALHKRLKTTFVYVTHDQNEAMTMSDRIALLSGGELLQIGTPTELYEDPANLEVARFLGTPAIGFIETVSDASGVVSIGKGFAAAGRFTPNLKVVVGIRPERVAVATHSKEGVRAQVLDIEYLGSDTHVRLQLEDGQILTARRSAQLPVLVPGQAAAIWAGPDDLIVFDEEGARLRPAQEPRLARSAS